jgi:hypothetical protein
VVDGEASSQSKPGNVPSTPPGLWPGCAVIENSLRVVLATWKWRSAEGLVVLGRISGIGTGVTM